MTNLVLLSGGIDSTLCLGLVLEQGGPPVQVVSFDYGQRNIRELIAARQIVDHYVRKNPGCLEYNVIELPKIFSGALVTSFAQGGGLATGKEAVVPFRNAVFLSTVAAMIPEDGIIWFGATPHPTHPSPYYKDVTSAFVEAFNALLKVGHTNVIIKAPLSGLFKHQIIAMAFAHKVPLSLTWTCFEGEIEACGECNSCVTRLDAFKQVGVKDPIAYKEIINA